MTARVNLTDEFARTVALPATTDRRYRDIEEPAFGLRVRANGKKNWLALTTVGRTVKARVIGEPGRLSADMARAMAASSANGGAALHLAHASGMTVAGFAETFLADWKPRWAPATERAARQAVERFIVPAWGPRLIDEIRRADVVKLLASIGENSARADVVCSTVSRLMAHAEALGLRNANSNPAAGLRRRKTFRSRFLSSEEYARVWRALDRLPSALQAEATILRLLIFTGARRLEIAGLRWSEIDGACVRLQRAKCGPRTLWLSCQALDLLASVPRVAETPFVFPNADGSDHVGQRLDRVWDRVRRTASLEGVRIHDLRHSFASVAAAESVNLKIIGALLGHRDVDSTLGYAHLGEGSIADACERNVHRLSVLLGDAAPAPPPTQKRRARRGARRTLGAAA